MPVVAVINRKGGSGKSTLATQVAAYWSRSGKPVMLGDVDRNQSAQGWLQRRQKLSLPDASPIVGGPMDPKTVLRLPQGVSHAVLDTPGGMAPLDLARVVCQANMVLIPLCASQFDREAAAACLGELRNMPRVASGRCRIAAVGMRVDGRTHDGAALQDWAKAQDVPFLGVLRDTLTYVHCVDRGLSVFDLKPSRVALDLQQWVPITAWLEPVGQEAVRPMPSFKPSHKPNAVPVHLPASPLAAQVPIRTQHTRPAAENMALPKPSPNIAPLAATAIARSKALGAVFRPATEQSWTERMRRALGGLALRGPLPAASERHGRG